MNAGGLLISELSYGILGALVLGWMTTWNLGFLLGYVARCEIMPGEKMDGPFELAPCCCMEALVLGFGARHLELGFACPPALLRFVR